MGSGPGGLCGGGWADRLPRPRPLTDLGSSLVRSRFRVARPGLVTATAKPSSSAKTLWFLGASASSPHRALFPARLCRPHSLDAVRCHRNVDPGLAGAQASAEASSGRGEAPPAGTRGGRRLRPAPAQTEPAAATGRCARAAKAPRGALRRGTMSSLYTRSKEFPRSRRAQPESPPASPSPTAKALRVSGAPLGTCRPWRGSGPGRRLLAGVGEGAQPRPAQRQSAWQRGSGVLVTLPPGAGVGLCSCSRGARGCRPTRSPMRAPRVCVRVSVRATAFARLGVRGRQGPLATRAVSLLIPRKRARGAREAAPAAGTSREGRRGRRARGLRVRVGCVCASASGRAGAAPAAGTSGSGPPGGVPRGHRFFPRSRVRRACERLKAAVLPGAVFLGAGPRGAEFGVWPVGRGGVVPGPPGVRCEPSLSQSHLREDRGLRPGAPGGRLCRVGWCRVSWGPTAWSPFPWFSLRSLRLPAGAPCYICAHRDRSPQARTPRGTRQPLPASR